MPKTKISIITICYNLLNQIEPTLISIANQVFQDFEWIVIDGGSKDGTVDVLKSNKRIDKLVSEPDKGIYDAMNKGLSLAQGEYVLFINGGDMLYEATTLSQVFDQSQGEDVLYGECMYINIAYKELHLRSSITSRTLPEKLNKHSFLYGSNICHQSFIVKTAIAPQFDLKYPIAADLDWMIHISTNAISSKKLPVIISKFLEGGISSQNLKNSWKDRFKVYTKQYGLTLTLYAHAVIGLKYFIPKNQKRLS